jgi:voltage-gated potassium channel
VHPSSRGRIGVIVRPALTCALILALYYVIPVELDPTSPLHILRVAASVVTGVAITWLILRQVSHHLEDPLQASPASLLTALTGGVVFFAFVDYTVALSRPGEFVGLETRTDGLYFALATLTTVGYGDVHAAGQLARAVVMVQLVFNVVVIATGASVLTRMIGARTRERSGREPEE